ncbi:hypothetical protein K505DRAFT_335988 [Melanomma pulvis-pyrius CBS 109.77]|uniref:Uncharacterized protein n=1 Tax=Melanomma pulvis-pyrius CBS 109.77 TaxID=1314802 RepID=A0A6A6XFY6_9PLEO|nr:hypothetical protein K505DRAFT_335988 [Melanomma pulvis-pyrius CBS 109.77]
MFSLIQVTSIVLGLSSVMGSPVSTGNETTVRYVEGSISKVVQDLKQDIGGVLSLGGDGVLRSFSSDLTVVDYRNLDQNQFNELHTAHVANFKNTSAQLSNSFLSLSQSNVDGRLVTDVSKLLHPEEKPEILACKVAQSKPAENSLLKERACVGTVCGCMSDCASRGCFACFFPAGPPHGVCFGT